MFVCDKPKRPLSTYNLFFQWERRKMVESTPVGIEAVGTRAKLGFAEMARFIAAKWKKIDPYVRSRFVFLAAEDRERYDKEMAQWRQHCRVFDELQESSFSPCSLQQNENHLWENGHEGSIPSHMVSHVPISTIPVALSYGDRYQGRYESQTTLAFGFVDDVNTNLFIVLCCVITTDINRYYSLSEWRRQLARLALSPDDESMDLLLELFC